MIREDSINKLAHSIKGSQNISVNTYFISHQLSKAKINRISFAKRITEAKSPLHASDRSQDPTNLCPLLQLQAQLRPGDKSVAYVL